jgi:hypothetical protein
MNEVNLHASWYAYLPTKCGYRLAQNPLPPMGLDAPYFLEYILAGNGLFVRSTRGEMEACFPIAWCVVGGGLPPLQPYLRLNGPRVPASLVAEMIAHSRQAVLRNAGNIEQLFFLHLNEGQWTLTIPPQAATVMSVQATLDALDPVYSRAVLEVHSHHVMRAFESAADDLEELGKFRTFAVLGQIGKAPEISVRVGMWAYFHHFPASAVFELPESVSDVLNKADGQEET